MAAAKLAASGLLLALCLLVSGTAAGRELQASRGDLRACKYEVTASRTGLVNLVKNLAASGNRITYTQSSNRWSGISTWTCPVYNRVPAYADCSSFISWVYWTAYGLGTDKLNGQNWKAGYTGTMASRGIQACCKRMCMRLALPQSCIAFILVPNAPAVQWREGLPPNVVNMAKLHTFSSSSLLNAALLQVSKATWVNGVKKAASYSAAQPGDLVFYGPGTHSHVAMYIGNGQVASFGSTGPVKIWSINYHPDVVDEIRSYIGAASSQF